MKLKYFLGLCGMLGITQHAYALDLCQTATTCVNSLLCSDYCCPDGTTGTTSTCPTGWKLMLSSGECERNSVDAGEDDKGYMQTQYGTCAPTTSTYQCYVTASTATVTINGALHRCVSCININAGGKV